MLIIHTKISSTPANCMTKHKFEENRKDFAPPISDGSGAFFSK